MQFKSAPTIGSNKSFLKLKDGESVTGVFRGNPHEFYVVWKDNRATVVPEGTKGASFRFKINFVMSENGAMVSKIFEQGATVYNMLKELHDEYGLENTFLKITRKGSDTNTTYTIMPPKNSQVTKDQMTKLAAVELQELAHEKANEQGPADPDEEIPF